MEIVRKDLLAKLEAVAPALAAHNLVPQMTHFWFTGSALMAYNDQIAISTPLKTDFKGAIPGNVLLALLKSSTRAKVELIASDTELQIKAGRTSMKLATMSPEHFMFDMPTIDKGAGGNIGKALRHFLKCLDGCMRSVGSDTSIPEQLGITIVPNDKSIALYATNSSTISCAHMPTSKELVFKRRVILSALFCKQLLALCKGAKSGTLAITKDYALLEAEGVALFGKLVDCEKPYDFEAVVNEHMTGAKKSLVPIPKGLNHAVERASIITDGGIDQTATQFSIDGDALRIVSKSDRGEVRDKLRLEGAHKPISVKVEPKLISVGLGSFDEIAFVDRCAVMSNDNGELYLISASKQ